MRIKKQDKKIENALTANWRFGATAAVAPQKRQCENERL